MARRFGAVDVTRSIIIGLIPESEKRIYWNIAYAIINILFYYSSANVITLFGYCCYDMIHDETC